MKTSDRHIPPILVSLFVAMVPFVFRLPFWIVLWCLLLWGLYVADSKIRIAYTRIKRIRLILTGCGFVGVLLDAGYVFGGDAYVGVLSVMAGLKPLEMRSHRDRMITVFIAYFIIITGLFESESLAITIYMFVSVFVTTAVLIHINHRGTVKAKLRFVSPDYGAGDPPDDHPIFYLSENSRQLMGFSKPSRWQNMFYGQPESGKHIRFCPQ